MVATRVQISIINYNIDSYTIFVTKIFCFALASTPFVINSDVGLPASP